MRKTNYRTIHPFLLALFLFIASLEARAQAVGDPQNLPGTSGPPARTIEDLNYLGGDAAMPPFSDSVISGDSNLRQDLLKRGMALRVIAQSQYVQNTLDGPVPADQQAYVGQRPFESAMIQPILTADLHQLKVRQAQFYIGGVWNWASWNPAGPKTLQLWDLYFYKAFGEDGVQMKGGYLSLDLEFVGMLVGGSTATGGLGVYAVLPYEAGMSYFPLTTPAFTFRLRGPNHTYLKSAIQRSLDPQGGPAEVARNHTGFRFIPNGDKLLLLNEGGYLRKASKDAHESWFRAGYMYNTTAFRSAVTGQNESGNYCGYALMDYQLWKSNQEHPNRGVYAGASIMKASDALNAYSRYYEARLYEEAPFQRRPADFLSVVASQTGYSRYFTDDLVRAGKTVSRGSTTVTGGYTLHTSPGNYLGLGLSYAYGPAITPRTPTALKFIASWTVFF